MGINKRSVLKSRLILLLILMPIIGLLLLAMWSLIKPILIKHYVPESFRMLYGENAAMATQPVLRKGNIRGKAIAIPSHYFEFSFEYTDKSVWEPPKPGDIPLDKRTFSDAVSSFSLNIRWPDLKPRTPETNLSYLQRNELEDKPWMSVGIAIRSLDERSLTRGRDGIIARLAQEPQTAYEKPLGNELNGKPYKVNVHYELFGLDKSSGLQWAKPVGPGTENFSLWNDALYWNSNDTGVVLDFIVCQEGKFKNPKSYSECRHEYFKPEWGAMISITYARNHLSQWREIRANVNQLLDSFILESNSISTQSEINKEITP